MKMNVPSDKTVNPNPVPEEQQAHNRSLSASSPGRVCFLELHDFDDLIGLLIGEHVFVCQLLANLWSFLALSIQFPRQPNTMLSMLFYGASDRCIAGNALAE